MMTIKTEFLNFLTGVFVTVCGVLNLIYGNFEMAMNWIIFGAMYLVMGDYLQNPKMGTMLEKVTDAGRRIFSWVGLIGSVVLLGYYLTLFCFRF